MMDFFGLDEDEKEPSTEGSKMFYNVFLDRFVAGIYDKELQEGVEHPETGEIGTYLLRKSCISHPGGIGKIWVYYWQRQPGKYEPLLRYRSGGPVQVYTEGKPINDDMFPCHFFDSPLIFSKWYTAESKKIHKI